ncbi:MAG: TPM domain-containing protein [Clostridia bacterium]|nr:TPM domain-containing protein [Clostridia bacterium]
MKKITISIYCALALLLAFSFSVSAESYPPRLVDEADILTLSEEQILSEKLDSVREKYSLDVVIVTVFSLDGKWATEYADDYYDYGGYGDDGILLLLSMEERDWAVSTKGYGMTVFTDAGIDYMMDQILDDLLDDHYYDAFSEFVSLCDDFSDNAANGKIYDIGSLPKGEFPIFKYVIIAFAVGFLIAFIATAVMKGQLKSVRPAYNAASYIKNGSFKVTESRDLFLYSTITKTPRPQNNSSGGRGGSSGHFSASGSRHGGRSGKF